jgi:putative nucleotidyltransferase with HDIG domain
MRMPWSGDKGSVGSRKRQSVTDVLFTRARMHWWLLGVIFALAVIWIALPMERLNPDEFELGEKSPRDVLAQVDITYYDETATEEKKEKALTEVPPVFELDFERLENAKEEFNIVRQVRADLMLTDAEKVAKMKRLLYIGLIIPDEVGLTLATASDEQIDFMEKEVIRVLSEILEEGVIAAENGNVSSFAEELSEIEYVKPRWERIRKELQEQTDRKPTNDQIAARMHVTLLDARSDPARERTVLVEELLLWFQATAKARAIARKMPEPIGVVVEEMCVDLMRPNLIYNPDITRKRREDLLSNFPPVSQAIRKGDKIIGSGEIVTESVKGRLNAISLVQRRALMRAIPGAVLLTALLSFILVMYLKRYESSIFSEPRKIIALNIAILLILILEYLAIVFLPALKIDHPGFLVPAALAPIMVAILANVQLAIVVTCVIGVFVAMLAGVGLAGSLGYFLVIFAGGIAAAISTSRARHRKHLMVAGVYVSGASVITILGLGLLENSPLTELGTNCLLGVINGVIVAVLTPGLLPIFEYLSRTTTDIELLELADLNQPLLTQLKENASGSYYHSIDTAELAGAAAEAIGANTLLTRVGSYYHDIGKMGKTTKPEYFIENQKGENVHDSLNPSMSARVIAAHVKEGVRIAKDHKLPQVVADIIQQHHGTTLIGGQRFYQKAMEADRHNTVRLEDYRYPGPKPRTKEAAIILLADSVESARHTILHNSSAYSRLVSFVREVVENKIMDFQLDECDLTLKDINLITDAFVRVLSGMYHTRIEYLKKVEAASVGAEGRTTEERSSGENR